MNFGMHFGSVLIFATLFVFSSGDPLVSLVVPGEELKLWKRFLVKRIRLTLQPPSDSATNFNLATQRFAEALDGVLVLTSATKTKDTDVYKDMQVRIYDFKKILDNITIALVQYRDYVQTEQAAPPLMGNDQSCNIKFPSTGIEGSTEKWTKNFKLAVDGVKRAGVKIEGKAGADEEAKKKEHEYVISRFSMQNQSLRFCVRRTTMENRSLFSSHNRRR